MTFFCAMVGAARIPEVPELLSPTGAAVLDDAMRARRVDSASGTFFLADAATTNLDALMPGIYLRFIHRSGLASFGGR